MISAFLLIRPKLKKPISKLTLIEHYVRMLFPYFKIRKTHHANLSKITAPIKDIKESEKGDNYSIIEENQILYAKLLTKKVMELRKQG